VNFFLSNNLTPKTLILATVTNFGGIFCKKIRFLKHEVYYEHILILQPTFGENYSLRYRSPHQKCGEQTSHPNADGPSGDLH